MSKNIKSLEFPLYFRSEEFTNKINKQLKHEQIDSFEDLIASAVDDIIDEICDMANEKGFYHADQINLKVSIEYQENEG